MGIGKLIRYGGVAAKVRAMYGKRLKPEDFEKISQLETVPDIAVYLRGCPGWAGALEQLSMSDLHRFNLETRLRAHLLGEYQRLFQFISPRDHALMRYPIRRAEIEQLMLFIRLLKAGRPHDYQFSAPEFYGEHSKLDFDALRDCATYSDLIERMRGTEYYAPLLGLMRPDGSTPEYTQAETVLISQYYSAIVTAADKHYAGGVREQLKRYVGTQVDLLNITHVIRLRRYFRVPAGTLRDYIIPARFKLREGYLEALYEADDQQEERLLKDGPYAKLFSENRFDHIEDYYHKQLNDMNYRYLYFGEPSVYSAIAYLALREAELRNLIKAIERVRYGLTGQE